MFSKRIILEINALVLCMGLVAQAQRPNVALQGTPTTSSTGYGWLVGRAIDGNLDTGSHTADNDTNRWWQVELQRDYDLSEIVIHNRASCCWERLENAVLKVLDANRNEIYVGTAVTAAEATQGSVHSYDNNGAGFSNVRYIRVEGGTNFLTIMELEAFAIIPFTTNPTPVDGAKLEATWAGLSWRPGEFAVSHDVYMSDNFDDVNDGAPAAYQGNYTSSFVTVGFFGFPFPDGLVPGTTYYWRVDEINNADPGSPWKGDVWSFWIPPVKAYDPRPSDGAQYLPAQPTLNWSAGFGAKLHYVNFGDNFDDVNNATGGTPAVAPTFSPGTLELNKTYYWRVDESNPPNPTVKGEVWSFTTMPDIRITDPNLIAWWTLDEGSGNRALDWSGHGNHATIGGTPDFVPGRDALALDFDGSTDFIDVGTQLATGTFTVAMWIRPRDIPYSSGYYAVLHNDAWNSGSIHVHLRNTSSLINADINSGPGVTSTTVLQAGQWYHCAIAVTDQGGNASQLYINGVLEDSATGGTGVPYLGPMVIGAWENGTSRHYHGLMDDIRVYDKVLTVDEITLAMRGDLTRAWDPSPAENSVSDVVRAASLSWSPGDTASQHAVYFGTDMDAVAGADASDTTGVFRGLQAGTGYAPPEGVEWGGGPYYWRVDEHNTDATVTKGNLWTFVVADYIAVDDFESYNDTESGQPGSNLIYDTWADGYGVSTNGSTAGYAVPFEPTMETDIVHGGDQSAPMGYGNIGTTMSEITRTFAVAQDWTADGVTVLSIWFYGEPANTSGQLYAKINGVQVNYNGAAADLSRPLWQVWNIDLATVGTNLQSVTSLAIGVQGAGATGTLLLDDFRLYRTAPAVAEQVWIEAEAAGSITLPMKTYNDPAASGGSYIGTDVASGDSTDVAPANGVATYSFNVQGGVYKIAGRVIIPNADSFWVRIRGVTDLTPGEDPDQPGTGWIRWADPPDGDTWHWADVFSADHGNQVVNWTLPAGTHTLEIAYREDGALLDAIVITSDVE